MERPIEDPDPIETRLQATTRPVILEFWAPWCVPCRQMEPILEDLSAEYAETVETVRVDADEHPNLTAERKIYTIPTVLIVQNGDERSRRSGVQSRQALKEMYVAAQDGGTVSGLSNRARFVRMGIAVGILLMAQEFAVQWPFFLAAGAVFFSAIHDRCPAWQAIKRACGKACLSP